MNRRRRKKKRREEEEALGGKGGGIEGRMIERGKNEERDYKNIKKNKK